MMRKQGSIIDGKEWFARPLLALALLTGLFGQFASAQAQQAAPDLPTEPILRIEAGQHSAPITRVDTDAANRFAVTASHDKTARVWSLPEGRLLRVLRVPIDNDNIGQARAVAISPDGSTVAVGGRTGIADHYNIFLFERASGALKQRISDLPSVIDHLTYSADGRRLAASLARNGIRVFDAVNGYRLLPSDAQYGDQSDNAQFDRAGRLVTASHDGYVRLYAADQYATPVARFEWKGHHPRSAAFSPDGTRVAIADLDSHDVAVLSGSDLRWLFKADTTGIPGKRNLRAVAWSHDGRFLYAGGHWFVDQMSRVRRWSDGGRGTYIDIPASSSTIFALIGLKSGSILIGSFLGLELVGPGAEVTQLQKLGALKLSGGSRDLKVSANGGVVQFDASDPPHTYRFALADRLVKMDPPRDEELKDPFRRAPGLDIMHWNGFRTPAVNGTPIKLKHDERSLSVAIVPGMQSFVLGADYSLHLFDRLGHDVWPNAPAVPGEVWRVNVSGDRRLIVAGCDDGTVRWHRLSDGKAVLALFIHPDGQRWVVWTPQGYYDASLGADELIGWHVNHGYDHVPDFFPVSQFRDRFYRPDVIRRLLQTPNLDIEEAVRDADYAAGRPTTKAAPVSSLLTPVVEILDPKEPAAIDRTDLQIGYSVRLPLADDSLRIEARIDGATASADDRRLVDRSTTRAGVLHLTIPRRDSAVSLIAYNDNGGSEPAIVHVKWRGPGTDAKLTLYVLAIGISKYQDKNVNLHFAAKDAADFVDLLRTQEGEGRLYAKVITHPPHGSLRDEEATREAVLDELDWIKRAVTNTNDVAMIFLSGHGMTTPDQHYRFLPHDYDSTRVERTTISDSELQDYLTKIGGKKIFFFDTCYSGAILGGKAPNTPANVDKFANELRAAENGVVVFASSTGNELSQEKDEWGNGAFAKALVEGLRGAAGRPDVPVVMISDLQGYVSRRVKDLTDGNQKPMMAMPRTVEDFPITVRVQ
jgi:WD40 repeat protein